MKFGGLPFQQYVQSRVLPDGQKLSSAADREMESLAGLVFTEKPELPNCRSSCDVHAQHLTPARFTAAASASPPIPREHPTTS